MRRRVTDADKYGDCNSNFDPDEHVDTDSYGHRHAGRHVYLNLYSDKYGDPDTDAHIDSDTY